MLSYKETHIESQFVFKVNTVYSLKKKISQNIAVIQYVNVPKIHSRGTVDKRVATPFYVPYTPYTNIVL